MCTEVDLPQKCVSLFKYGHALLESGTGLNGTYATHLLIRSGTHITQIPEVVTNRMAVACNCALATVCAVMEAAQVTRGGRICGDRTRSVKRVWVQGAGLLGMYACAMASVLLPTSEIFVSDPAQNRLDLVASFGGTPVHSSQVDTVVADCSVDLVLELAGYAPLLPQAIAKLRPGGVYVLAGLVHPRSSMEAVTGEQIIRKCLTISGVHNYAPRHLDQAVQFLLSHHDRFPFESLISPTPFPLSQLDRAVEVSQQRHYHRECIDPSIDAP
eukprot:TRINITY_DN4118_c0_g3_i1.p1 TRINITY_DN4118_c0_g3~~TRINITY_DN4118_c0_g3_i1.p1  ORF type:complete len:271 (+),score=20.93 TRINITY_DN4118_c0_g3_i1:439-1251(+)